MEDEIAVPVMKKAQLFGQYLGFTGTPKYLLLKADWLLTYLSRNSAFLWVFSNTNVATHSLGTWHQYCSRERDRFPDFDQLS